MPLMYPFKIRDLSLLKEVIICPAAAELTHVTSGVRERWDSVRMCQQGVLFVLFTAGCVVAFGFSLWIPFKGNELLLFGCLAPLKYSDVRITLGNVNFGNKCIKKECHLLS